MKKNLLFTMLALPSLICAQSRTFEIKGKVGAFNSPVKAYLIYKTDQDRQIDSATLVNGSFSFTGTITEPTFSQLIFSYDGITLQRGKRYDVLNLYLDKGNTVISGADSVSKATISGSKVNADYKILQDKLRPVNLREAALKKEFFSASEKIQQSSSFRNDIKRKDSLLNIEKNEILLSYVSANPATQISLGALQQYAGQKPDANKILTLFNNLSPAVKESYAGRQYAAFLSSQKGTAIGSLAPDFSLPDTSGKPIRLSSYKGRYVLVDFWASWCGPCREENPNIVAAYAKYHEKGFEILGISLDQANGRENWLKAIHHDGLSWTQVSDLKFWNNEAAVLYGVKFIPQNFLIGPDGKIVARDLLGKALNQKLAALFNSDHQ